MVICWIVSVYRMMVVSGLLVCGYSVVVLCISNYDSFDMGLSVRLSVMFCCIDSFENELSVVVVVSLVMKCESINVIVVILLIV